MKKVIYILLGLILTVSMMLTGCGGAKELTAQEVLTNAITAMQKITSYKLDYNLTMDMDMTGAQAMQMAMDGGGTGAMDVTNQKIQMTMDADVEIPGVGTSKMNMTMSMEMFLVEGWLYTKMTIPGSAVQWSKMEIPDITSQDQAAQLLLLMESAIETNLKGSEKVNGVDCYILEVVPDMEALWEWAMSQQGSTFTGKIDLSKFDLSKIMKDVSLKYWIAKNNYQIIKAGTGMTMDADAESLGVTTEEFDSMTMTMNFDMTFSDYNKAVTIELPADAKNAQEVEP
jgi:Family of unknown function (DUF6612)